MKIFTKTALLSVLFLNFLGGSLFSTDVITKTQDNQISQASLSGSDGTEVKESGLIKRCFNRVVVNPKEWLVNKGAKSLKLSARALKWSVNKSTKALKWLTIVRVIGVIGFQALAFWGNGFPFALNYGSVYLIAVGEYLVLSVLEKATE